MSTMSPAFYLADADHAVPPTDAINGQSRHEPLEPLYMYVAPHAQARSHTHHIGCRTAVRPLLPQRFSLLGFVGAAHDRKVAVQGGAVVDIGVEIGVEISHMITLVDRVPEAAQDVGCL